ncbi:oxidoreductase molybdopterin binding protein [Kribbella flavida DSM 17836]|uniref:Oxidoreductase molybdopterin binding protein n=1 Tax=Kribbella flavida (strain DSM 17836 / JCM 10339 / NBRC 14399) TaxID=479435 RepID=D2PRT3_KRIFD|nr:molybdopterin-dependent oxidoreductase [Kribbella flavida]ADB29263.1 oxidoreductase molybdopterin binding protein [Kribbella flavida DSM 17836]
MNQPHAPTDRPLDAPGAGSTDSSPRRRTGLVLRAALGGVLAALAGLAAGSVAAALLGTRQTPVVAIGSAFIDRVPPWLKDLAISLFGVHDKTALRAGILIVLLALAAVGGLLAVRRYWAGAAVVVVLAGIAVLAAATRPDSGQTGFVPSLVAGLAALLLLRLFSRRLAGLRTDPDDGVSRRGFLQLSAGVTLGTIAIGALGKVVGGRRAAVAEAREGLSLPLPPSTDPPAGVQAPGAAPWVTPNDEFYRIDTALSVPLIMPSDWRLRIHGLVGRELELTFDDLLERPVVHQWVTLTCVSNEVGGDLVGNALWSGVLLKDLLAEARPAGNADAILSTSKDGFTAGTPLSTLLDDRQSMLAFAMNGQPLPLEHGFPVRIVVPGLYGYVSATKWLTDIEVSRFDRFEAYWTPRGWSELGPIKLSSRIDVPRSKAPAGQVTVAGVAWDQHVGVSRVEVRVDGGAWQEATLAADPSTDTWRQWHWSWNATRGNHVLQVRAFDAQGNPQVEAQAPPAPNGSTGLHSVDVNVG